MFESPNRIRETKEMKVLYFSQHVYFQNYLNNGFIFEYYLQLVQQNLMAQSQLCHDLTLMFYD